MLQFYLQHLSPGSDLDLRRTTLNADLVNRLLDAAPVLGTVNLAGAVFEGGVEFGRLVAHRLTLDGARFDRHVQIEVRTDWLTCVGTRFEDGATMRVGHGVIVAERTVFGAASSIASGYFQPADHEDAAFKKQWDDAGLVWAAVVSLRGTDASNLVLVDIDLRWCLFAGAHRLDQLRFEGDCWFNSLEIRWPMTRRIMLAEDYLEHVALPLERHPFIPDSGVPVERVIGLYRSLRKALEDSKNEAGAGDFYYGEMNARRRYGGTPWAERVILRVYWLLSGYGQRAGRAIAAVGVLVAIVCVLLFTVGLPGGVDWTWGRVDQSLRIGMGAVVFREAGQTLTSAGSWTVMVARFVGPVLLALGVLAVRARVKR